MVFHEIDPFIHVFQLLQLCSGAVLRQIHIFQLLLALHHLHNQTTLSQLASQLLLGKQSQRMDVEGFYCEYFRLFSVGGAVGIEHVRLSLETN